MPRTPRASSEGASATQQRKPDTRTRRRSAAIAISFTVVIVAAATWFSNAQAVEQIAIDGEAAVRSEAALSAASVALNRVSQAEVMTNAVELGAAHADDRDVVRSAALAAILEFAGRSASLDVEQSAEVGDRASVFIASLEAALDAQKEGDLVEAAQLREASNASFDELAALLVEIRNESMSEVLLARDSAGEIAFASRLVVAFMVPLGAVLLYRFMAVRARKRNDLVFSLANERSMLEAKDELIANISHELRTPLTGILGFAQTSALDDDITPEDMKAMMGLIASEADELSRMVEDLITSARDDQDALTVSFENFSATDELESVLIPIAISGRKVRVEMEPLTIRADRLRFRQILRNLVSNALRHGGPDVAIEGRGIGGRYLLSVSDDGDGVPQELAGRLFSRFVHQGDAPLTTGSIGLGLSIAARIASLMEAELSYERVNGRTEFTLSMPLGGSSPS